MHISKAEISKAISKLKNGKSPGLDNIPTNMLKWAQNELLPKIEKLFNSCLSSENYPKNWAVGYITPIHNAGDISDPNNYRGISVTSVLGKLFNSILDNRLYIFLEKLQIIDTCQDGFTRKTRTIGHLFILKCIIDKDGRVFACFVDFQKAFDIVIHTGIKIKLLRSVGRLPIL